MGGALTAPRRAIARGAFLSFGLLASCGILDPTEQNELDWNRERWRDEEIASYSYVIGRSCYCGSEYLGPVRVEVRADSVAELRNVETGALIPSSSVEWPTVEDLFDTIEDALERDAASLEVDYHPELHYPTSVVIDYDERVADEEITYTATELRRVTL